MNFQWVGWCREDNHDKVWALMPLTDGRYATVWGRRGKTLQSKIQAGWQSDRDKAVRSKRNKGYQQISLSQLETVYPEFQQDLEQTAVWVILRSA